MKISNTQKSAIKHNKGAMLVLAGPGSGKTTVITNRTRELVETYGVSPEKILVITFTRAAAMEMKQRFLRLCGKDSTHVNFGTFHAVFFKILKYAYSYDASNILSEEERYMYLRDLMYKLNLEIRDEKEFLSGVGNEISLIKNNDIKIEHYYSKNCAEADFRKLYSGYNERLRAENKIDYDDMLLLCYELLSERKDILKFWQDRYEYILIDEFQDINLLQYKIVRLLALPENNIFAVGDDDQSIYGFRGAKPQIMLGFEKDYPKSRKILLDTNYRSGDQIISAAAKLIGSNTQRFEKQLESGRGDEGYVCILNFKNSVEQDDYVARKILDLLKRGEQLSDCAVLYRLNSQPRDLVRQLNEYNIRFKVADRLPDIFEHWIAGDLCAYFELADGSRKRQNFIRIANRPKRYISRDIFIKDEMSFFELEKEVSDKPYVIRALDRLRYDLDFMKPLNPYARVKYIRNAIGYDDYIKEYANYRGIDENELYEVLDELEENMKGFACTEDLKEYIAEYREKLRTAAQNSDLADISNSVKLMTFHGAKGLEFNNVFIIDANEGMTPYSKAGITEDIEEERRMFYVAMTRAKERLYILSSKERFSRKLETSRFVKEIQE